LKKLKNNGFTLIELSVVLILAGIIIASALVAYRLEIERRSITTTKKNLEIANTAIVEFQKTNGFYPCPASGTDTSARAGDCFNSSGTGFKRISIASQVLRMGIMPISSRDKNGDIVQLIHGEKSFDGFRRRIVYAVLENHAKNAETFSAAGKGLITILNSNDISGTPASTSSYYVLFSAGPDGSGAYTPSGVLYTPCSSSTVDSENCDDDAVFVDSIGGARNLSGSNNHYDDFFTGQTEVPKINKSIGRIRGTAEVHGSYSMEHTTYTSANAKYTDENCLSGAKYPVKLFRAVLML
jgi:prepilin-type N-terminal cleavage/methylation domain-containing protein